MTADGGGVTRGNEQPVVRARGLRRHFGRVHAVDGIDLEVPRGIILGLLGDNGAGKTTTLRMLLGLLRRGGGDLEVLGADPRRAGALLRARLGYVPEDRRLYPQLTVRRMLRFAASLHPGWDHPYADELVERFELNASQRIGTLSRGGLARLYLLLALAPRPELLILDEATGGIDVLARRDILRSLVGLVEEGSTTIVFASHSIADVERIADRVVIMHRGRILVDAPLEELRRRYGKLRVRFTGEAPPAPAPGPGGILAAERRRAEWLVVTRDLETTRGCLPAATQVQELPITLEEILVETLVAGEGAG